MIRRAGIILMTTMAIYALPTTANGQSYGKWNPVFTEQTVDAEALGTRGRGFFEYATSDYYSNTAAAGIGALGGMFRVTYAHSYTQTVWGLGYARMLAAKDAGKVGTLGMGVDFSAAMDLRQQAALASRAARMSIPLSLRWGSPSRLSIAPYIAPYGEIGRATAYHPIACGDLLCNTAPAGLFQTHALGIASGVQLTAWRLSLEVGLRDLPKREFGNTEYKFGMGLRWRF